MVLRFDVLYFCTVRTRELLTLTINLNFNNMSVRYKLVQNNREGSRTRGKWYARAVPVGVIRSEQIAEDIEEKCSLTKSDVLGVITELVTQMRKHLLAGERVILDGFGGFKCGIATSPADSAKDFTPTKNVKSVHIIFQPTVKKSADGKRVKSLLTGVTVEEFGMYHVDKKEQP